MREPQRSDDCAGWLYPSVKSFGGENVALKPSAASQKLRVKEAYLCEVSSLSDVTLSQQSVATVDGDTVTWANSVGRRRYFRSA